ncbi:hypothetical protein H6P81_008135 [Aristolochia fimbriata]|uniref:Uncharacterized protein n=1 Tax=Aristolochia fimbriata TaxID=158543 RepID=A0AAV7F515_ARIFI|nr:hypothetical protein H6P81_008135 [Aristolochia fimbriata]
MASSSLPDIWAWIQSLPPITDWKSNSMSITICSSLSPYSSLKLTANKNPHNTTPNVIFFILADFHLPISLWTSNPLKLGSKSSKLADEDTVFQLFHTVIIGVLNYAPIKNTTYLKPHISRASSDPQNMFNLAFYTLMLLVCIYEAPQDLRFGYLNTLKHHLTGSKSREASKLLMRVLGSNLEEQWMRSLNLAITNWTIELQASPLSLKTPSPLFSYALSTVGMWKVQLYCPIIAMDVEKTSNPCQDERLFFSLMYQQLEGVVQLGYRTIFRDNWVELVVNVDNIRCDVIPLASEILMAERGIGAEEKHFPSRVSLQITPIIQTNVLSVSVSKSSDNPTREIGMEKTIEGSFDPPTSLGLKLSAGETITMTLKPWKFEQSVQANSVNLNWFLHDSINGREVFSSKPPKMALFQPKAWFKDRYASIYRPFTKQGGVVFAGDEYGDSVLWKLDKQVVGKTMEWEIRGWIWLTYWPNKHRTFYSETRRIRGKSTTESSLAGVGFFVLSRICR